MTDLDELKYMLERIRYSDMAPREIVAFIAEPDDFTDQELAGALVRLRPILDRL
jgi:hypothetical protein